MKIEHHEQSAGGQAPGFTPAPDCGPGQALTAARLIEWVAGAQRGARLTWATGVSSRHSAGERVADLVTALGAAGFVTAHFQKAGGEGRYIVQRSERRAQGGELAALAADVGRGKRPSTSLGMSGWGKR